MGIGLASLCLVAAGLAGGWFLAGQFESTAQREARVAAPSESVITAEVQLGDLEDVASLTADVTRRTRQTLPLQGFTAPAVVTASPLAPGATVTGCASIMEINGRPLFALAGAFPFYRALSVGDTGPDVRQLQSALSECGFSVKADGAFGGDTESAVRSLYRTAGYSVPLKPNESPGPAEDAQNTSEPTDPIKPPPPSVSVPAVEMITIAALPSFVVSRPEVGTVLTGAETMVVESGSPIAVAVTTPGAINGIGVGAAASIQLGNAAPVDAVLEAIGAPDTDGNVAITFTPMTALPDEGLGQAALVTLVRSTAAQDALLIPTRSVVSSNGKTFVLLRTSDNDFVRTSVQELGSLNGMSAISSDDPAIRPGAFVRVT